ncbi:Putative retroelement [Phytophthora palmivora]|uniref:Retroelement n=1 Tax=Phytophthora palmivora TaxID=4796 RepID=A0A2P4YAB8_9STRA|nr:Putative retroelement [Phytophthora palmivora]
MRRQVTILAERRPTKRSLRHFGGPARTSGWHTMSRHVKTCQRVKSSGHASAPLLSLPVPADCWKSMSLDFDFGLPANDKGNTGILVFVCRLSKMVHLAPLSLDSVFRYHGLPETIVSDRDPRFTGAFWDTLFQLLGTKLTMSTADHPQTDVRRSASTACSKTLFAVSVPRHLGPGRTSFLWLSLDLTMRYTHQRGLPRST